MNFPTEFFRHHPIGYGKTGEIMKIDDLLRVQQGAQNPQIEKRAGVRKNDFAALLQDEMSETGDAQKTGAALSPDLLSGVLGLEPAIADPALADRISTVENVIARLDILDQALNDNSVSPKKLDGIIKELGEAATRLQKSVEGLSGPLAGISQEVNVLAYMEAVKLRRGDYL
jgi:hypothetical protein